ncbi:MAG TPA: polymer-forming cytoskeletal protein [Polyangia bacterium]|jgi:cytoskeletal protein CcmA (bactofilin family)|nr:polymer-forming cytoskeletal protein [Polyangia bacterium]
MPVPQPNAPAAPIQGEINTLLGKGSSFEGKLIFEGTVRIDGTLTGEIFSDDVLVVGEGAKVMAKIEVGVLIVEGYVEGNVRASRAVELHAPARVRGNLETPSLFIDKGVIFEGNCKMENLDKGSRGGGPGGSKESGEKRGGEGEAARPAQSK